MTVLRATRNAKKWVGGSVCKFRCVILLALGPSNTLHRLWADSAGVNTTQGVLRRFIYNMIIHPEMQERAQAEIDSVTEGLRLPMFDE